MRDFLLGSLPNIKVETLRAFGSLLLSKAMKKKNGIDRKGSLSLRWKVSGPRVCGELTGAVVVYLRNAGTRERLRERSLTTWNLRKHKRN